MENEIMYKALLELPYSYRKIQLGSFLVEKTRYGVTLYTVNEVYVKNFDRESLSYIAGWMTNPANNPERIIYLSGLKNQLFTDLGLSRMNDGTLVMRHSVVNAGGDALRDGASDGWIEWIAPDWNAINAWCESHAVKTEELGI